MLDTLEPWQFEESYYYSKLEPWGDDWERTSLTTARLINSIQAIAASISGEKLEPDNLLEDDDFVKKIRDETRTKQQINTDKGLDLLERSSREVAALFK